MSKDTQPMPFTSLPNVKSNKVRCDLCGTNLNYSYVQPLGLCFGCIDSYLKGHPLSEHFPNTEDLVKAYEHYEDHLNKTVSKSSKRSKFSKPLPGTAKSQEHYNTRRLAEASTKMIEALRDYESTETNSYDSNLFTEANRERELSTHSDYTGDWISAVDTVQYVLTQSPIFKEAMGDFIKSTKPMIERITKIKSASSNKSARAQILKAINSGQLKDILGELTVQDGQKKRRTLPVEPSRPHTMGQLTRYLRREHGEALKPIKHLGYDKSAFELTLPNGITVRVAWTPLSMSTQQYKRTIIDPLAAVDAEVTAWYPDESSTRYLWRERAVTRALKKVKKEDGTEDLQPVESVAYVPTYVRGYMNAQEILEEIASLSAQTGRTEEEIEAVVEAQVKDILKNQISESDVTVKDLPPAFQGHSPKSLWESRKLDFIRGGTK